MGRDIFEDYIRGLSVYEKAENIPKMLPSLEDRKDNGLAEETVHVLREISRKLDDMSRPSESRVMMQAATGTESTAGANLQHVDLAIINGMVVFPDSGTIQTDIYVKDGKICGIGKGSPFEADRTIDASGKYVCPGIIDPHVHLGLFAPLKTDLMSETKAAVIGGITTIGVYFGGGESHFQSFPKIEEEAERYSYTDIVPHLVIGNENQKREIRDYATYLGVTSFKVYMNGIPGMIPSVDDGFIMDVFEELKKTGKNCILCCHTENTHLVGRALRDAKERYGEEGKIEHWAGTHPSMAEEEAVMRLSYLAEKAKMPVYMVHIGTKESANRLRTLKPYNKYLHVETTSPYLSVTGEQRKDALYKMEPPLREEADKEELWKAFEDGIIDTIGTDNVCETASEKQPDLPIWDVVPGYSVVETHLASVLTEGVWKRGIGLEKLIAGMTKRPAETFGIYPQKGSLLPGSDADIVLIDLDKEQEVHASMMASRSDFSIFEGRKLRGWPVMTIKGGRVVAEGGKLAWEVPSGRMLKR